MPHIHTQPDQHDHTVTAYIIRRDMDQPRLLMHMHKKLGKLMPVGGHIELNETPWAAMMYEVKEEAGYDADQLSVLQPELRISPTEVPDVALHPQPLLMNTHDITPEHFHSDTGYLLEAHGDPRHELADGESSDIRWLTRDELASLGEDEVWHNTRVAGLAIFDNFINSWQPVAVAEFTTKKVI